MSAWPDLIVWYAPELLVIIAILLLALVLEQALKVSIKPRGRYSIKGKL